MGSWWQVDGHPNEPRWEGELASEGADEWLAYTHSHEPPTETEMHEAISQGEANVTRSQPDAFMETEDRSRWGVTLWYGDDGDDRVKVAVVFGPTPERAQRRAADIAPTLRGYLNKEGS